MATHGMTSDHGRVDRLAEEFLDRQRRGERPAIAEYVARHPEWADEIREVFPALVMMEQFKPTPDDLTGSYAGGSIGLAGTPRRLGDYRILREVGRGGMGVVYEAVQETLGRHVALKVLPEHGRMDAGQLERFRLEARSAARLHHTHIVPVFDIGEHDGVHFYSMQFIRGQGLDVILQDLRRLRDRVPAAGPAPTQGEALTLSVAQAHGLLAGPTAVADVPLGEEATEAGPAPDDEAPVAPPGSPPSTERSELIGPSEAGYYRSVARIGARVADALAYAHAQGILHRDIKPSNLLLDAAGEVWVADFGLAKLEGSDGPTAAGDVVGTLRYMAPERFQGRSDPRSDVYGLGATLYELLALRPAFDDEDRLHLIDRIAHEAPTPPRLVDRLVPRDLEAIVLKAVAKDPDDRFPTAAELRDELNRFVQNRPTRTRPLSPPEQLWRWCKRNPLVAGLNALAAALTIVIAVVSTVAAYRNGRLAEQLKGQRDETARGLVQAKKNLIQAHTTEAEARRQSRRVGQRFEALGAIERAMRLAQEVGITEAERFRLRNEAIAALALLDLRVAKELVVSRAMRNGFAVDPAFERYAFKRDDGTVIVRRLVDDAELLRLPGLAPARGHTQAGFSPDGRYLAMTSGKHDILQVWDLRERRLILTDREMAWANPINWSFRPDGRELALGRADQSIVFYELPSGRLLRRWTERTVHAGSVAYSPDGSKLAIRAKDGSVVEIVTCEGARLLATLPHPAHPNHFVWNPRRPGLLAVACEDNVIYIWNVDTGKQTMILKGETYNGIILAYHPNGELLASRGWHGVLRLWDTRTGRMVLSRPSAWASTLEFDRTGRWLNVDATEEKARTLEVADAAECRTLVREPFWEDDRHHALDIDPTGRRAVTTGSAVTLWDLPTGATLATLPVDGNTHRVFFDASGAVLTSRPFLLRWPVGEAPDGAPRVGPPRMLQPEASLTFSISRDGRTIAWPRGPAGGLVFDTADPTRHCYLGPLRSCDGVALSPDGRWAVTNSHYIHEGLHLWDAQTGRLVHDFPDIPDEVSGVTSFSPDGRWLAVQWDGWVLFETTSWTPRVRLYRGVTHWLAFAPDSRTAVYDDNAGTLIVAEVEAGRELARLEDPEQARVRPAFSSVAFRPDGSQLVTTLADRPYFRVWDLRAIRGRLAGLGLDWDPPATFDTPDAPGPFPPTPKPFRVDPGPFDSWRKHGPETPEQTVARMTRALEAHPHDAESRHERAHALARLGRFDEAVADFTAALEAGPDAHTMDAHLLAYRAAAEAGRDRLDAALSDAEEALRREPTPADRESVARVFNHLAWTLATGPAPRRGPARALDLARRAVGLSPDQASYLNTLGVALYRDVRHAEAVPVLERSLAVGKGESDAYNLFFLAMCRHRLRDAAAARADFARAVRWLDAHPNLDARRLAELKSFRAEAESVLAGPPGELPADVFAPATDR
jgi:serine/threonine protein kinase/WD40 repeat protein/tetratricopeptide (TPR) repeat protein